MEETQTQPSKKVKTTTSTKDKTQELWDQLKESAVPAQKAVFHKTVTSYTGEPEYAFYANDPIVKKSRSAKLWCSPHFLLIEQPKGFKKMIPMSNVSDITISHAEQ